MKYYVLQYLYCQILDHLPSIFMRFIWTLKHQVLENLKISLRTCSSLFWDASITSGMTEQSRRSWTKSGTVLKASRIIFLDLSQKLSTNLNWFCRHCVRAEQDTRRCSIEPSTPSLHNAHMPVLSLAKCFNSLSLR